MLEARLEILLDAKVIFLNKLPVLLKLYAFCTGEDHARSIFTTHPFLRALSRDKVAHPVPEIVRAIINFVTMSANNRIQYSLAFSIGLLASAIRYRRTRTRQCPHRRRYWRGAFNLCT
jgi:hypothetical protein